MTYFLLAIDFTADPADILDKFWRFFIVGGGGFAIDVSMTYLMLRGLRWHKYLSNSLGFLCGVTFNYTLNRLWTFSSNDPQGMLQYTKFALIGVIGLGIVNGVVYILHTLNRFPFFRSKVLAMIVFMFWNFSANYFYTFR